MENSTRATKALANFLDPRLTGQADPWSQLRAIDELSLVEILRRNKVALEFERKLEMDLSMKEKVFSIFPRIKIFLNDLGLRREEDSKAFKHIGSEFTENGIDFLLIKSDGSFPYESDNIDVLIKPRTLSKTSKLLKKAGYSELDGIREPHKFLFRNIHSYEVLPLHIHTRVEWEGREFVDSQNLWSRSGISDGDDGFRVPSHEDCILITVAHLFFENHEVKLADLFKIASRIRNYDLDWDYVLDHSRKLHWDDAFCLSMLLVNHVHESLLGRKMLQQSVLSKMEEANQGCVAFLRNIIKPSSSGYTPLEIPYSCAAFFFVRGILCDSGSSLSQRLSRVSWIASDVLRRRVLWSDYLASR